MNSFFQFRLQIDFGVCPMTNGLEILCIYCRCWWCWFQNKQHSNERLPLYYRNASWLKLTTVKKNQRSALLSLCDRRILLTKVQLCGKLFCAITSEMGPQLGANPWYFFSHIVEWRMQNAEWMFIWHPINVHEIRQKMLTLIIWIWALIQYKECGDKTVGHKIILSTKWDFLY